MLSTLSSIRGVPNDALVGVGHPSAVVRGLGSRAGRDFLIEIELNVVGRNRVLLNRQKPARNSELLEAFQTVVFAPDDLRLVKSGPADRRDYLDGVAVGMHPRNEAARSTVEKVLRQRNALLKQSGGRLTEEISSTLSVWDEKFVEAGEVLGAARAEATEQLEPLLSSIYELVAGRSCEVGARYIAPWRDAGLAAGLVEVRDQELRRGVSLVGPHRDDLELTIGQMSARTHASQGEQRSLAFALRLAAHAVLTSVTGVAPTLLLDDVFSELDESRAQALVAALPECQTITTSVGPLPAPDRPPRVFHVADGVVTDAHVR